MLIYAIADIHGRKENIDIISWVSRKFNPDLIVIAGDITNYFGWESTIRQLDQLTNTHLPIVCILGNSDFKKIGPALEKSKNLTLLNALPRMINKIPFMGTNGTIPLPFASRVCMGEKRLFRTLFPQINKNTILVVHTPPRGICDKVGNRFSAGSQNLTNFIKATQPRMLLCGHIHEQAGMDFVNTTLVVNCAMNKNSHGAIIDLKKGILPEVNFLQP